MTKSIKRLFRKNLSGVIFVMLGIITGVSIFSVIKIWILHCSGSRYGFCFVSEHSFRYFAKLEDERHSDAVIIEKSGQSVNSPHENAAFLHQPKKISAHKHEKHKKFMLIGVMTAKEYINTRVLAAYRTWVNSINGKVIFFSSANTDPTSHPDIPIISLPGTDDTYPPQKKSFMMFKYILHNYIDEYEWFLRVDDDVYVKGDELERFLRSIDSSGLRYIGQRGIGPIGKYHELGLKYGDNYCLGGPGVILSADTVRVLGSHAEECLKAVYTTHEDVELGRCIRRHSGVKCTSALEMQQLFFHNYGERKGSFLQYVHPDRISAALILHPLKLPTYLVKMHNDINSLKIQSKNMKMLNLRREISKFDEYLGIGANDYNHNKLNVTRRSPMTEQSSGVLTQLDTKLSSTVASSRDLPSSDDEKSSALDDLTLNEGWEYNHQELSLSHQYDVIHTNSESKQGFMSYALETIITHLNNNPRPKYYNDTAFNGTINYYNTRLNPVFGVDFLIDMSLFHGPTYQEVHKRVSLHRNFMDAEITNSNYKFENVIPYTQSLGSNRLYFILLLLGEHDMFVRFLDNYIYVCIKPGLNTELRIVLQNSNDSVNDKSIAHVEKVQQAYPTARIKLIKTPDTDPKNTSLLYGIADLHNNSLLFLVDVDLHFNVDAVNRVRRNTVQGHSAYVPITFQQYNPETVSGCTVPVCYNNTVNFDDNLGSWSTHSFGFVGIYKSDYVRVLEGNGTTTTKDLYQQILYSNLTVHRSVDTGLFHRYREINCRPESYSYQRCQYLE